MDRNSSRSNRTLINYLDGRGHINSILEDREGHVWMARTRVEDGKGPLCEVVASRLSCYGKADGIEEAQGQTLALDSSGRFWLGSDGALTRWTPASSQTYHPYHAQQTVRASADALAADREGGLWVGFFGTGQGLGLEHFEKEVWRSVRIGAFDGAYVRVSTLLFDSSNSLWVGTDSEGLYRIHGNTVEHFGTSDGLSGDHVTSLFEDEERNIWLATPTGIDCFRDLPVVSYTKHEGLTADHAHSVYAAKDGTLWVGNAGGLDAVRKSAVSSIRTHRGFPGSQVTAMLLDHRGRLWLGVDDDLYLYEQGHFRRILDTKGNPSDLVTQLAEDVDGSIWAAEQGPVHRLLHIRDNVIAEQFQERIRGVAADPHGGVWSNLTDVIAHRQGGVQKLLNMPRGIQIDYISDIVSDPHGTLWASIRQGVLHFDGDKTQLLGASNGLPCPSHGSLIFDSRGSLWLTQSCGIVRIDQNSLQNWIEHPEAKVSTLLLNAFDGVQIGFSDFHPSASLGRDGRLWIVNGSIVQMLDPEHLHINTIPPPIQIEQLIADHKDVAITSEIHLPPLTRDIEIDYTALSFVVPQRVRFRYKLEGHDKEWQDGGTRRSAFYTDLAPGTFKFSVTACNNSGVWKSQGAEISFAILPAWYQTIWFRLLAFLSLALLVYVFYLLRMRQFAAAMRARFNERVDERVRIARELHDTLLQSFHGLMFQFQAARNLLPERPESAMQAMDEAILATEQALGEGRDAIRDLRPDAAAEHDLAELLTAAGQELAGMHAANRHLTSFRVIVEGKPRKLSPTLQDETYRIGSEVIRNAFNHADASKIEVEIRYDENELRLRVRDDGKGIDPRDLEGSGRPGHWGLQGIRERAQRTRSRLNFWSEAGAGTEVELRIPAAIAYEKERRGHLFRILCRGGSNEGRT
jgi:signal transduction histidine kinase/ligand-binding sensor domain-containing protein